MQEFEMFDLGNLSYFLRMEFKDTCERVPALKEVCLSYSKEVQDEQL